MIKKQRQRCGFHGIKLEPILSANTRLFNQRQQESEFETKRFGSWKPRHKPCEVRVWPSEGDKEKGFFFLGKSLNGELPIAMCYRKKKRHEATATVKTTKTLPAGPKNLGPVELGKSDQNMDDRKKMHQLTGGLSHISYIPWFCWGWKTILSVMKDFGKPQYDLVKLTFTVFLSCFDTAPWIVRRFSRHVADDTVCTAHHGCFRKELHSEWWEKHETRIVFDGISWGFMGFSGSYWNWNWFHGISLKELTQPTTPIAKFHI